MIRRKVMCQTGPSQFGDRSIVDDFTTASIMHAYGCRSVYNDVRTMRKSMRTATRTSQRPSSSGIWPLRPATSSVHFPRIESLYEDFVSFWCWYRLWGRSIFGGVPWEQDERAHLVVLGFVEHITLQYVEPGAGTACQRGIGVKKSVTT